MAVREKGISSCSKVALKGWNSCQAGCYKVKENQEHSGLEKVLSSHAWQVNSLSGQVPIILTFPIGKGSG